MVLMRRIVLGVAVVLIATAGTAFAASSGSAFRLGVANSVAQLTRLSSSLAGAVMLITNSGSGPALQLNVKAGSPPLAINSSVKVNRLNADLLDGMDSSAFLGVDATARDSARLNGQPAASYLTTQDARSFLGAQTTKRESPVEAGQTLSDGTHKIVMSCSPGEVVLSGGPANINAGTVILESFPAGNIANPDSWAVRIQNAAPDNFSVVIICTRGGG
jgi:hypothetical protein